MSTNQLVKSKSMRDLVQSDAVKARLKEVMGERSGQFAAALVQIVNGSYQLQQCDPASIIGAAITAASLDLSCDPNLGEAHLVPYKDKCQLQVGYRGFIQLAMRSEKYKALGSAVVYDGQLVSYDELTGELVIDKSKKQSDMVIGYAAKFKLLSGFERAEYWTTEEIEAHASRYSKAYKFAKGKPDKEANCLWVTDRDAMALKTVEKSLLAHYGPKSIQMSKAIKMDGGAVVNVDTEEVHYLDNDDSKTGPSKPVFDNEQVVDVQVSDSDTQKPAEVREPAKKLEPVSTGQNKVKAIKLFLEHSKLKEIELVNYLRSSDIIDDELKTIDAIASANPSIIDMVYDDMTGTVSNINKLKGGE